MGPFQAPLIQSTTLDVIHFYAREVITEEATRYFMKPEVDIVRDIAGRMIFTLKGCLLGEDAKKEICEYPANWQEAFKERWFPRWALRRWPVKREKFIVTIKAVYPDYRPALPSNMSSVRFATMTDHISPYKVENE